MAAHGAFRLASVGLIYSYRGLTPPAGLLTSIRHGEAAGVIFFGGNISTTAQITDVISRLDQANASPHNPLRRLPLLLMTDQEGGLVRHLPGAPAQLGHGKLGYRETLAVSRTASWLLATYSPSEDFGEVTGERSAPGRRRNDLHHQSRPCRRRC